MKLKYHLKFGIALENNNSSSSDNIYNKISLKGLIWIIIIMNENTSHERNENKIELIIKKKINDK
jgi:hypothetical protein